MGRSDIEQLGFTIIAVTKHADGVSYDAHYTGSAVPRFMVRGPKRREYDDAIGALYVSCVIKGEQKGILD